MRTRREITPEDDTEDACEHHATNIREFFASEAAPDVQLKQLSEALYAISERSGWKDEVDSVSVEQALYLWRVVEKVRKHGFPKALRM
jgi:hypothetical protein